MRCWPIRRCRSCLTTCLPEEFGTPTQMDCGWLLLECSDHLPCPPSRRWCTCAEQPLRRLKNPKGTVAREWKSLLPCKQDLPLCSPRRPKRMIELLTGRPFRGSELYASMRGRTQPEPESRAQ